MTMDIFSLESRVICVTGGYGHLGRAICRGLADHGATVYVLGRSEEKFTGAFGEKVARIEFVTCDVSSTPSVRSALDSVVAEAGALHVMVNNAFYARGQDPLGISDEDWGETVDGVLSSVYRCIREAVPHLKRAGGGKIINVSSMYGMVSPDFSVYETCPQSLNPPHYGAGKAGVIQLTRYFAWYLGADNIQVNAVSPGPFPNDRVRENQGFVAALAGKTALKRVGKPGELQGAFVFLSSAASDYVTGHNLVVDGGWTAA